MWLSYSKKEYNHGLTLIFLHSENLLKNLYSMNIFRLGEAVI